MRPADALEVRLSSGATPREAVFRSVDSSPVVKVVALLDEDPVAVFGVGATSLLSERGSPWLLGTSRLALCRRELAARSRAIVCEMAGRYRLLENYVHADNVTSVRWLASCGFRLEPAAPYGVAGALFHRFWKRA